MNTNINFLHTQDTKQNSPKPIKWISHIPPPTSHFTDPTASLITDAQ